VQSATGETMLDRPGAEAEVEKLPSRDDSMLAPRKPPNSPSTGVPRSFD